MGEVNTALIKVVPQADESVIALYGQTLKLEEYATAMVIDSDDIIKAATNDLSIISGLKKAIEEKRKEYTQPINSHLKAINEAFKILTEPINNADTITRENILAYRLRQDLTRKEEERINLMRMDAAKAEMELKGELTESVDLIEVTPELPNHYRAEMGMASQRDTWKYEVTDFALLPDEFKLPDTTMLNSIAKKHHDQKQIPGVRFYNEPTLAVRPTTK